MHLPSITALRALDAIARYGSVSRAAQELCLTRSAVSHQVTVLEESLGFALLERSGRGVVLSYKGAKYVKEVRRALSILQEASRCGGEEVDGSLCVSCPPGFATYWLCRQISEFLEAHPHVELSIVAPRATDDVSGTADVFIAYGTGEWQDMSAQLIATSRFFPVCSPTLLNAMGGAITLDDLANIRLLHMVNYSDWTQWLLFAGANKVDPRRGVIFSDAPFVQSAAIAGQGMAMGDPLLSGEALACGLLIRPFNLNVASSRGYGYYLVARPEPSERPVVRAFVEWVKYQLQVSIRAWEGTSGGA